MISIDITHKDLQYNDYTVTWKKQSIVLLFPGYMEFTCIIL